MRVIDASGQYLMPGLADMYTHYWDPADSPLYLAHGITTVRWSDMRFAGGIAGLEQPTRSVNPFTATVRVDPDGRILDERIVR